MFGRGKRRKLRQEIEESLRRTRDALDSMLRQRDLCEAVLGIKSEQLQAAEAVNDEASARELMDEMRPLLTERDALRANLRRFAHLIEGYEKQKEEVTKWV